MQRIDNIGLAIGNYPRALGFIFRNSLGWYFIFPVLMHIGLFYAGMAAVSELTNYLYEYFNAFTDLENAEFFGAAMLAWLAGGFLWLIFRVVFFFIFAYFGGFIVLILLSPVLAVLSEKTEKIVTGKHFDTSPEQIIRDIFRGIAIALRNMFFELGLVIMVFFVTIIIGAIPVFGWGIALAGQAFLFLVSSYFFGFSFIDYSSERRKLNVTQSTELVRQNRGAAIGAGLPFALCLLIPFIGSFLASFLAIVSVVAASLTVLDLEAKGLTNFSVIKE